MAQNISLMATKYHLVSTYFGGTDDYAVEKLLSIDGRREVWLIAFLSQKKGNGRMDIETIKREVNLNYDTYYIKKILTSFLVTFLNISLFSG